MEHLFKLFTSVSAYKFLLTKLSTLKIYATYIILFLTPRGKKKEKSLNKRIIKFNSNKFKENEYVL